MISQDSIEEVKAAASLVEIVSESVELQTRSSKIVGCCPFHNEKTPSFHVHEDEGYYYCFGCGESGNVISFLMKTRGLRFPEAVEYLAERYGVTLQKSRQTPEANLSFEKKVRLSRLNLLALKFFRQKLEAGKLEAFSYLESRGLTEATQARFLLGYADDDWRSLSKFLKDQGAEEELLLESGLVRRNSKGELYDLFRDRVIFPILGENKKVLAFGGRCLPGAEEGTPKYINSPETLLYRKSEVLYGLPYALGASRNLKKCFVVEGYLDVIALHSFGIENVVATCGTALTEKHLAKLGRISQLLVLLFDGDRAGRKAAARSFDLALRSSNDLRCIFMPEGHDPDSFVREFSAEALGELPLESLVTAFIENAIHELGAEAAEQLTAVMKGQIAKQFASKLSVVDSEIVRTELIKEASFLLKVEASALRSDLKDAPTKRPVSSLSAEVPKVTAEEGEGATGTDFSKLDACERVIVSAAMVYRDELPAEILCEPDICLLLSPAARQFIEGLEQASSNSKSSEEAKGLVMELLKNFGQSWLVAWKLAYENSADQSYNLKREYKDALGVLFGRQLEQAIKELDLQRSLAATEAEREELLQRRLQLQRRELSNDRSS